MERRVRRGREGTRDIKRGRKGRGERGSWQKKVVKGRARNEWVWNYQEMRVGGRWTKERIRKEEWRER